MFDENDQPIMETVTVTEKQWVTEVYNPTKVYEASDQTTFNTKVQHVEENPEATTGSRFTTTQEPSVALQMAVGMTGNVIYKEVGEQRVEVNKSTGIAYIDTSDYGIYGVMASGSNSHAQLGRNLTSGRLGRTWEARPVFAGEANPEDATAPLEDLMYIATSPYGGSSLAYDNNYGAVYAWGNNNLGQAGDGTNGGDHELPVAVLMDGEGAYLDISHVLMKGETGVPSYTANLQLNLSSELTEEEVADFKGGLYLSGGSADGAATRFSAVPGTEVASVYTIPEGYYIKAAADAEKMNS